MRPDLLDTRSSLELRFEVGQAVVFARCARRSNAEGCGLRRCGRRTCPTLIIASTGSAWPAATDDLWQAEALRDGDEPVADSLELVDDRFQRVAIEGGMVDRVGPDVH